MTPLAILRVASKAVRQHALRTGLTMLGIIMGVAAVIGVVAIAEGAHRGGQKAHVYVYEAR